MLGLYAIGSRPISSPTGIYAVSHTMAASGPLVTFGGYATGGAYILMSAGGTLVRFSGTAQPSWDQTISASGTIVDLDGSARLTLLGRPIVLSVLREPYIATAQADGLTATALAQSFIAQGMK